MPSLARVFAVDKGEMADQGGLTLWKSQTEELQTLQGLGFRDRLWG